MREQHELCGPDAGIVSAELFASIEDDCMTRWAETDELYFANLGRLTESKVHGRTIIAYLLTIRYLERISDHASYISESISYAVTGKRVSLR